MASELGEEVGHDTVQWNERDTQSIQRSAPSSDAAALQAAKKERLLELLTELLRRGRITPADITSALRKSLPPGPLQKLEKVQSRTGELQADLRYERATCAFLEGQVTTLQSALAREHELVKEGLYRIAALERQLQDARETTTKLAIASRDSLRTLRRVGTLLDGDGFSPYALDPLIENLCQVARAVGELNSVAGTRDVTPRGDFENR